MENQKIYNRFAVFVIEECYPSGGLSDIVESFDNIEDAVNFAESLPFNDCVEIVDFDKRQIVWKRDRQYSTSGNQIDGFVYAYNQ